MNKTILGQSDTDTEFGHSLIEGLNEAVAWKKGKITLAAIDTLSFDADQIKAIRKSVAKSPREFSSKFKIPVRTLEGWEQGRRRPDPAACVLLRVIEKNAKAVEDALAC
jgi:putative transcriptional regulator